MAVAEYPIVVAALVVTFLGLSLTFWAINADWARVRAAVRALLRRGGGCRGRR
jgi:hypothetical protein